MNTKNLLKKISTTLFVLVLALTTAAAQGRYKHLPRVKVDVNRTEKSIVEKKTKNVEVNQTTTANLVVEESPSNEIASSTITENVEVASANTDEIMVVQEKSKTSIKQKKAVKAKKKVDIQFFTQQIKEKSKLLDVKDTEKTNANIPLILLIVFYILAVIFTVLCIVFLLGSGYNFTLFLVFLILALVFALAASVLLTLMKIGVF